MSLTRFNDDDARIKKKLQEMTGASQYQLNAPGPGVETPFFEDAHIRLQKWGANLRNNTTNLESDLIGINRKITKRSFTRTHIDTLVDKHFFSASPNLSRLYPSAPVNLLYHLPEYEETRGYCRLIRFFLDSSSPSGKDLVLTAFKLFTGI